MGLKETWSSRLRDVLGISADRRVRNRHVTYVGHIVSLWAVPDDI